MKASGVIIIWKRQETQPHKLLRKSNTNKKTVFLILTSVTSLCEFPEKIIHKFSYENPEM